MKSVFGAVLGSAALAALLAGSGNMLAQQSINQQAGGVEITISAAEQASIKDYLTHPKVHIDEEDGTSHGLIDATQLLQYLKQKETAATAKAASAASPSTDQTAEDAKKAALAHRGPASQIGQPSPTPNSAPTPTPSSTK